VLEEVMMRIQGSPLFRTAGSLRSGKGFTLIEMLTVIAILGILLAIAAPSFTVYFEKYRAKRAAETINAFFVNAKSEAIKRNTAVRAVFTVSGGGATWCAGLTTGTTCTCTTTASCQLDSVDRVISSADFTGVLLTNPATGAAFTFNSRRGTTTSGNAEVTSAGGQKIQVKLSGRGRIKLCSPSVNGMGGYSPC
jgi:prepilin-type N-terminal cleavage/methylation domain-containing protein